MCTAKQVAILKDWRGDARVYELDPPIIDVEYVIVSAADVPWTGPETYIFPAHRHGDVFQPDNMLEMDGSYRGGLDHAEALEGLGYVIET